MFTITIGRRPKATVVAPAAVSTSATGPKRPKGAWKADPISPKQIGTISGLLRRKGLVADDGTASVGSYRFRYDDQLIRIGKGGVPAIGGWTGFEHLTKGDGSVIMDSLKAMPDAGFGEVVTSVAEPIAPKDETVNVPVGAVIEIDGQKYQVSKGKLTKI